MFDFLRGWIQSRNNRIGYRRQKDNYPERKRVYSTEECVENIRLQPREVFIMTRLQLEDYVYELIVEERIKRNIGDRQALGNIMASVLLICARHMGPAPATRICSQVKLSSPWMTECVCQSRHSGGPRRGSKCRRHCHPEKSL